MVSSPEKLLLHGFSISGFRSFGPEQQLIGPLKKINVIIGENNSGKSNISRFIRKVVNRPSVVLDEQDRPSGTSDRDPPTVATLRKLDEEFWSGWLGEVRPIQIQEISFEFLKGLRQTPPKEYVWLERRGKQSAQQVGRFWDNDGCHWNDRSNRDLTSLWKHLNPNTFWTGSPGTDQLALGILDKLEPLAHGGAPTHLITSARKIETRLAPFQDEFGQAQAYANPVIDQLAAIERPEYGPSYQTEKAKFARIQDFVRQVLGDDNISIEIPNTKTTINVQQHGRTLPIEALGTGVFQAVLLAAEATIRENSIICIEEPELHLHPEVQRQVISYLANETSNQYFITTHSAHIMDAVDCCVIDVRMEDGQSIVRHPIDSQEKREICHRLGYRPSDLLQANSLIWIEGPSDRIYIKHWLHARAPDLLESVHFSFSLYGGRVLSNFSIDEDSANDLIKILPINRFPFVVMDSDRRDSADDGLNSTKTRILDEVKKAGGGSWVTGGREIENYLSWDVRSKAVLQVHKGKELAKAKLEEGPYDAPLEFVLPDGSMKSDGFNKNKIASAACEEEAEFGVLDLEVRIDELVAFIRRANRMT